MRYSADAVIFIGVFFLGLALFQSPSYALLAAAILAGATEAYLGDPRKR